MDPIKKSDGFHQKSHSFPIKSQLFHHPKTHPLPLPDLPAHCGADWAHRWAVPTRTRIGVEPGGGSKLQPAILKQSEVTKYSSYLTATYLYNMVIYITTT